MVLRVWILLCWLALSSVTGSAMGMANAAAHPGMADTTASALPSVPALPDLDEGLGDEATPPATAEWSATEPVATLPAAPWRTLPRAQGAWQRSAHAPAPRGPVLDGLLRPPKRQA